MPLKTTINIKASKINKVFSIADQFNVSKSFIINSLMKMSFKSHSYKTRLLRKIQYQDKLSSDTDYWKCLPISFQEDVYEKNLDMKKLFKLSSSLIISDAIDKYLEKLILQLEQKIQGDNYSSNYILLHSRSGSFNYITLLWDTIDLKKLQKLQQIHNNP